MSFFDTLFTVVILGAFIITLMVSINIWDTLFPIASQNVPTSISNNLNTGWDRNVDFFDSAYPVIFIIIGIISIMLTIYLYNHPVFLVVWLLINLITLVIYDGVLDAINAIAATSLNTSQLNTALDFFRTQVPRLIIVINIIMAVVMLGKRGLGGNQ